MDSSLSISIENNDDLLAKDYQTFEVLMKKNK